MSTRITEDVDGFKCWNVCCSLLMLIVDAGKNLRPRNTPELSVDFNLVIGDLNLSKLFLLIHA